MSSIASSLAPRAQTRTPFALVGLGTVVAAVIANTLFYYLAGNVVAYDPEFLPLADVWGTITMTLAPAIVAVLLYAALRRFTRQPARNFTVISAIVFVVTLIPDLTYIPTVPGSTNSQIAVLLMMHVVAAAVIVCLLTQSSAPRPHTPRRAA